MMLLVSRRFLDAAHQDHGQQHHDDEGRPVESKMPAGAVNHVALQVLQAGGEIGGRNPFRIGMPAEPVEQVHDVRGKADADGHVADGIFQDEVPADNPGDQFAHGGVGVGVGAAGNGNHGGEFRVADGSETADDGHENKRQGNGRASARTPEGRGMVDQSIAAGARSGWKRPAFSVRRWPCQSR